MDGHQIQIPDLQPEIWNRILLNLWEREEDLEHLLTCRLVCRSWEELVDRMPPKRGWKYWNPWLKYIGNQGIFDSTRSTSFQCDSDVSKFLSNLSVQEATSKEPSEKNPFPNQTVRLFKTGDDIKTEVPNLLKIIKENGHHIKMLLYKPNRNLPETLTNLPQLLSHMGNLVTLMFDSRSLLDQQWRSIHGKDFPPLSHLRELVLMGEFGYRAVVTRSEDNSTMYAKLSVTYGAQIKSITFTVLCMDLSVNNVLTRFPNLEELKIECLQSALPRNGIEPFGASSSKLKRLALGIRFEEDSESFKFILKFVSCFAETLELVSLSYPHSASKNYEDLTDFNRSLGRLGLEDRRERDTVTLPRLEKLVLPFGTVRGGGGRPLERRFSFELPKLKSLILEDVEDEFKKKGIVGSDEGLKRICEPIWRLVPPSVETICFRAARPNLVLQRDFPVIYICHRNGDISI